MLWSCQIVLTFTNGKIPFVSKLLFLVVHFTWSWQCFLVKSGIQLFFLLSSSDNENGRQTCVFTIGENIAFPTNTHVSFDNSQKRLRSTIPFLNFGCDKVYKSLMMRYFYFCNALRDQCVLISEMNKPLIWNWHFFLSPQLQFSKSLKFNYVLDNFTFKYSLLVFDYLSARIISSLPSLLKILKLYLLHFFRMNTCDFVCVRVSILHWLHRN